MTPTSIGGEKQACISGGVNPPADIASGRIAEVRSRSMSCNCMTRTSQQECRGILESKMPEQSVLRLSDAYESKSEELDLELKIRFVNINPGYNEEMIEKSPTLYQYVKFVDTVRKYQQEMPFPEAVEKAIDECIKNGILAEFLRKNRAEVLRVSIFEYDEEEHMRQEREESRQEGFEQMGKLIVKLNQLGRQDDILKVATDAKFREELLEKFHLD